MNILFKMSIIMTILTSIDIVCSIKFCRLVSAMIRMKFIRDGKKDIEKEG